MTNTTLTKTFVFAASRETVWSFLTEKEKLAKWFHPALSDLVEGEDYSLVRENDHGELVKQCWGSVIRMDKPNVLVYSFTIDPLNGAMTTVTWTLEELQHGTKLTLQHEGIEEAAMSILLALDKGWDMHADLLRNSITSTFNSECS